MVYIKTEDIYVDIAKDIYTRFDAANLKEKEKVTGLLKNELGGKISTEISALIAKAYSYLVDS